MYLLVTTIEDLFFVKKMFSRESKIEDFQTIEIQRATLNC